MSASKCYYPRQNLQFLSCNSHGDTTTGPDLELDERDLYDSVLTRSGSAPTPSDSAPWKNRSARPNRADLVGTPPYSHPVNVPDWSKILGEEHRENPKWCDDDADGGNESRDNVGGDGDWVAPPHEFLARTRIASFSVHEGVGRTLKGRDLSRVRNAVYEITGFLD